MKHLLLRVFVLAGICASSCETVVSVAPLDAGAPVQREVGDAEAENATPAFELLRVSAEHVSELLIVGRNGQACPADLDATIFAGDLRPDRPRWADDLAFACNAARVGHCEQGLLQLMHVKKRCGPAIDRAPWNAADCSQAMERGHDGDRCIGQWRCSRQSSSCCVQVASCGHPLGEEIAFVGAERALDLSRERFSVRERCAVGCEAAWLGCSPGLLADGRVGDACSGSWLCPVSVFISAPQPQYFCAGGRLTRF